MPDPWPLRHLVLRTPRLTLCPDDDEGLYELAGLALCGVHLPHEMPFLFPWTNFLVRYADQVIGAQGLSAKAFPILGVVSSGSWLGCAHQRQGFGTEMRAAVLLLAFDHLGATTARSGRSPTTPRHYGSAKSWATAPTEATPTPDGGWRLLRSG
jgi:hypothetical protein